MTWNTSVGITIDFRKRPDQKETSQMIRYFVREEELRQFLLRMLETEGFREIEPPLQESAIAELLAQLEDDTATLIAECVHAQDAEILGALIKRGALREGIQNFVYDRVPGFPTRLVRLLEGFRDYYVQEAERPGVRLPLIG